MLICHTKLQFQKNNKSIEINIYTEIKDSASELMKSRGLFVVAFSMRKPPVLPGVNKKPWQIKPLKSGNRISGEILRRMCDDKRVETIEAHEMQNHALTKSSGLVGAGPGATALSSYGFGLCSLIMSVLFQC